MTKITRTKSAKAVATRAAPVAVKESFQSEKTTLPFSWTATEYAPRKRWWWFLAFGYIVLAVTSLLFAFGNWSAGLLAFVIGIAVFRWYLPKPRQFEFILTRDAISISGTKITWPLGRYRAFIVEQIPQRSGRDPFELVVLIPKGRFGTAKDMYLPDDVTVRTHLFETLTTVLPYDETLTNERPGRAIDRMARMLRLG